MRFASGLSVTLLSLVVSLAAAHAEDKKGGVEKLYILNCGEGVAGDISRWSPRKRNATTPQRHAHTPIRRHVSPYSAIGAARQESGIPNESTN